MSLWELEQIPMTYDACPEGVTSGYHGLCTATNRYTWKFDTSYTTSFYYSYRHDTLMLWIYTYNYDWWRPWPQLTKIQFNAQTGVVSSKWVDPSIVQGVLPFMRTLIETGSFWKVYGGSNLSRSIFEMDPDTLSFPAVGGWQYNINQLPLSGYQTYQTPWASIVNREDNYLGLIWKGDNNLYVFRMDTKQLMGTLPLKGSISDIAYEDRLRTWVICSNAFIHKFDYQKLRSELLTTVAQEAGDLRYMIAWDTRRKRIAVFRQKADAADGACQSRLDFFRPIPKSYMLTDPVPIRPLRCGKNIPFVFNLIGNAGEGINPYRVDTTLVDPPIDGSLSANFVRTGAQGVGRVEYRSPLSPCTDTIKVSANITDGE